MSIRRPTWLLAALAGALLFAACKKDANLKATKSDCDDACTHATALNSGKQDAFARRCSTICVEKEWTVGDARCVNDAKTYDDAQNCGAVAKAMLDLKEGHAGRKGKGHRRRKGKKNRDGQQPDKGDKGDQGADQGEE